MSKDTRITPREAVVIIVILGIASGPEFMPSTMTRSAASYRSLGCRRWNWSDTPAVCLQSGRVVLFPSFSIPRHTPSVILFATLP